VTSAESICSFAFLKFNWAFYFDIRLRSTKRDCFPSGTRTPSGALTTNSKEDLRWWVAGLALAGFFLASPTVYGSDPRLERGLLAARRGDCMEALVDLRAAIASPSLNKQALTAAGLCETQLGHPEQATVSFQRVVELDPKDWQGWLNLGSNYLTLNQPDKAVATFREATKLKADNASLWFNLGLALDKSRNPEEAFEALERAHDLSPKDGQIQALSQQLANQLTTRAAGYIEKKTYAKAKLLLLRLGPSSNASATWHNLLGQAEFKLGEAKPAIEHLQKALHIEPDNEQYLMDLSECLIAFRAYDAARKFLEVGLKRSPDSTRIRFGLAVAYQLDKRPKEAVSLLENLRLASPEFEPSYIALGIAYESLGKWEAMIELGASLKDRSPHNPNGWYLEGAGLLGLVSEQPAKLPGAISALKKSLSLGPESIKTRFMLAKSYLQAGNTELAERELQETLRLAPDHSGAHYVLGQLYRRMGKPELARLELEAFQKAKDSEKKDDIRLLVSEVTSR